MIVSHSGIGIGLFHIIIIIIIHLRLNNVQQSMGKPGTQAQLIKARIFKEAP